MGGFSSFMTPNPASAIPAGDGSTPLKAAKSCRQLFEFFPNTTSGLHWINPGEPAVESFRAYCDMLTEGGGWTLVAKLKDHTAGLDNHLSHKYVGASWYSDENLETVVTGTAANRSRPLVPFVDNDSLWGNYDISLFGDFTQMLFYFLKTNADVANNKFYMFNITNSTFSNFDNTNGVAPVGTCAKYGVGGTTSTTPCITSAGGGFLAITGNNRVDNYYLGHSCSSQFSDKESRYQGLCISRGLPSARLGYNFIA